MAKLEKACADSTGHRCDVVTLYSGGAFHLYEYKRFTDVRLVWAPENDAKHFGGEQDNFNFPRMSLDVSFFRVYERDKPLDSTAHHFAWSEEGAKEGQLVFVSGHPGSTGRLSTPAELLFLRDHPFTGLMPFFIDWQETPHPASTSPAGGRFLDVRIASPQASELNQAFEQVGLRSRAEAAQTASLAVTIAAAGGETRLASTQETLSAWVV